jgi:hypothetical protein
MYKDNLMTFALQKDVALQEMKEDVLSINYLLKV